ncbi:MAG: sigma-54-dependent Fis family transcriptional regulator [Deltaproteobacteria bacterium]|nr:sigma-54-dependent Fis family transcriptional regulator [Deltaproteobacteria bacterium]
MRVLVLEDEAGLRRLLEIHLSRRGVDVVSVRSVSEAVEALCGPAEFQAFVTDLYLPDGSGLDVVRNLPASTRRPATIVMTGDATIETAVGALRLGALDYLLKPFSMEALDAALLRVTTEASRLSEDPADADVFAAEEWRRLYAPALVGSAPPLLAVIDVLRRIAASDCSVLISGETGTGKELVARALHAGSGRRGPFIALNCAAVPENLMESEMFGHSRGAYTGAQGPRIGRFQSADGGTLFLDEVAEMPLTLQAKLLRAVQEKEVVPLGENEPVAVDVRVVAATHRDLEEMVHARQFREDLLYRLDVIRVELPPLRQRTEDIDSLVALFLRDLAARRRSRVSGITPAAMAALRGYGWPGNVRQLQNVLERMVLLRGSGDLTLEDVPERVRLGGDGRPAPAESRTPDDPVLPEEGLNLKAALERFEMALIRQALTRTGGNKQRAAALLQVNRTTLVERLRRRSDAQAEAADPDE